MDLECRRPPAPLDIDTPLALPRSKAPHGPRVPTRAQATPERLVTARTLSGEHRPHERAARVAPYDAGEPVA